MEISIPWIVKEEGYTIKVDGQLFLVEASTSLSVRQHLPKVGGRGVVGITSENSDEDHTAFP